MSAAPRFTDDRDALHAVLARDKGPRLYEFGDLDPGYWSSVRYIESDTGDALAMLFLPPEPTVLLAMGTAPVDARLAASLHELLDAPRYYGHLSPVCEEALVDAGWRVENPRPHLRMMADPSAATDTDDGDGAGDVHLLGPDDADRLTAFLDRAYPAHTFLPPMLDRCPFAAVEVNGELAAVAGAHIFAPAVGVAALGNIATAPEHRGHGHGARVTRALMGWLHDHGAPLIGLNVAADNDAAIRLYERLGFRTVCPFTEVVIHRPSESEPPVR